MARWRVCRGARPGIRVQPPAHGRGGRASGRCAWRASWRSSRWC